MTGGRVFWPVLGYVTVTVDGLLHAAPSPMGSGLKEDGTGLTTACGAVDATAYGLDVAEHPGTVMVMPWPPRSDWARDSGTPRCVECHKVTGRPRPSACWATLVTADRAG